MLDRLGETRLVRATVDGDLDLVKELIGKGAGEQRFIDFPHKRVDLELPDNAGWSALHDAAEADIARCLLEVCMCCQLV